MNIPKPPPSRTLSTKYKTAQNSTAPKPEPTRTRQTETKMSTPLEHVMAGVVAAFGREAVEAFVQRAPDVQVPPYVLKTNTIPGDYHCGDLPGNLQYQKSVPALATMVIPEGDHSAQGWERIALTHDVKKSLLGHTQNPTDWTLVMAMKRTDGDCIWIKGALRNKKTGNIGLMTCCSNEESILRRGNRAMRSNADGWFVGRYRMSANLAFWASLKDVCATL